MANYPASVYTPRTKENLPGYPYAPANKYIGYAEDLTYIENEVLAMIADMVGTGVAGGLKGAYSTLSARLANYDSMLNQDVRTSAGPTFNHLHLAALDIAANGTITFPDSTTQITAFPSSSFYSSSYIVGANDGGYTTDVTLSIGWWYITVTYNQAGTIGYETGYVYSTGTTLSIIDFYNMTGTVTETSPSGTILRITDVNNDKVITIYGRRLQ